MFEEELFPLSVAVMVGQLTYHEAHGWTITVASRPQCERRQFGGWTTYGPMTFAELASLLPELVI